MDDLLRQVSDYLRSAWGYRWLGLIVAWCVGLVGMGVVLVLPDQYQATAKIYVDTQSLLRPLMSGLAIQPNIDQQINMLSRTLISRPNIEKLIRMADLDLEATKKSEREVLIDNLMRDVKLSGSGRDNLYFVSFRDEKPARAQKVVQAMVTLFVESGLGGKRQDADQARKFIEEQIKVYEAKLLEAENRLKEFKLKNLERPGMSEGNYFAEVDAIRKQLSQAQLDLKEAINSRDAIKQQIANAGRPAAEDAPAEEDPGARKSTSFISKDEGRIQALRSQVDQLLQRYTDDHPDIKIVKKQIDQLEQQKNEEYEQWKKDEAVVKAGGKPNRGGAQSVQEIMAQQLNLAVAEAEASVASMKARVAEYENRYAAIRTAARLAPEIEAEFAQLNRDHGVHRSNYEQLLARRESASIGEEMDATGVAEFRLIEPPRVAPQPVAPNRLLLLSVIIVVALLSGFAASFLTSQIRPVFNDGKRLAEVAEVPVLGSISMLFQNERKKLERRRNVFFYGGIGCLIATYGAFLGFVSFAMRAA
ncbi:Wzz/FepE/Etk N-terminal domain-containing protein [Methyloversatilis sp. XJ19-13]|uniref:XrtA system polysaccharide chain length determinant n=1 Tax=Methyloversatilis sp. XJ19-13 TaxID=2963430 RepID=UPI00211C87C8|nr:Wzz/FepE/Etk N-terminal domain-containing protein [Methyloversatilis sp. XJ19-13]